MVVSPNAASNCLRIPLQPPTLRRVEDRYKVLVRRRRVEEFRSRDVGCLACLAAAAWWHQTGPFYRNAEPHRVILTTATLGEMLGFHVPSKDIVELACADPRTFFQRLPPSGRMLASLIFDNMHPTAQYAGHIYGVDYFHTGWWVEIQGVGRELKLMIVTDLYTRFVVAWATFVARPRSRQFLELLEELAEAGLLSEIIRFDNERCFLSCENLRWMKFNNVRWDPVPPGLPQFNGVAERINQTFERLLPVEAPSAVREDCDNVIGEVARAYHHRHHASLNDTPANLAAGFTSEPLKMQF